MAVGSGGVQDGIKCRRRSRIEAEAEGRRKGGGDEGATGDAITSKQGKRERVKSKKKLPQAVVPGGAEEDEGREEEEEQRAEGRKEVKALREEEEESMGAHGDTASTTTAMLKAPPETTAKERCSRSPVMATAISAE